MWSEYKSRSWAKEWELHPHLPIVGLKPSAIGLAPSPSSLTQVANQKVTQAASTECTAMPSQGAFADPNISRGPQEGLELTPGTYVAINCVVADRTGCLQWDLLIKPVSDLVCWQNGRSSLPGLTVLLLQSSAMLVWLTPEKKRCFEGFTYASRQRGEETSESASCLSFVLHKVWPIGFVLLR